MSFEIKVPDLGDGVVGKILKINVNIGDKITKDTVIAEINTDKVDAEVPAEVEGTVVEIRMKEGAEAKMGDVLLIVDTISSAQLPAPEKETKVTNTTPTHTEPILQNAGSSNASREEVIISVPSLNETDDTLTATVSKININVGDAVKIEQAICELQADKVDVEVLSEYNGIITAILVKEGDVVKKGHPVVSIQVMEQAENSSSTTQQPIAPIVAPPSPAVVEKATETTASSTSNVKRTSPLAKKLARELGVDLNQISANNGRISKLDVINFYAKKQAPAAGGGGTIAYKSLPDFSKFGAIRKEAMPRITEVTAENMTYAWSTVPHAWILEKVDITEVEKLRNKHKDGVKAKGAGLTITAIIAKAVAKALLKHPYINASCDMANKEIIFKDYVHLGIAVDTPRGLLVPVIRDCDKKSIFEIAQDLTELSARTRDGKNKQGDMDGGTFTISNVGGIGGSGILPIVNAPQGAILGVTGSEIEGVWNGTAFEPRLRMQMTIGFDHRIINGAEATRFLQTVKQNLEDPFLMNLY